ncbi:MAG: hypothetical protein OEX06_06025 [Candidatus Bathyarchaeota archaeon]|nr:hypothetical protein [Candidatus Bathyarchaeota archaeon]
MELTNKRLSRSLQEEVRKFQTEILDLKGKKREEATKTYRRLLLPSADEPIYFVRS